MAFKIRLIVHSYTSTYKITPLITFNNFTVPNFTRLFTDYEPGNGHEPTFFRVASHGKHTRSNGTCEKIGEQN